MILSLPTVDERSFSRIARRRVSAPGYLLIMEKGDVTNTRSMLQFALTLDLDGMMQASYRIHAELVSRVNAILNLGLGEL